MQLNPSFCYNAHSCNNPNNHVYVEHKHVQQHTWKVADLCTRDALPTRWNTICTHQAFYLPAGERRGIFTAQVCGYLRQHHLQTLCFTGSETPPYFCYIYFVPSLAIAQIALLHSRDPDPSTMTHPCKVHELHHYVREIVGNNQKQSERLREIRRAPQPKADPKQLV